MNTEEEKAEIALLLTDRLVEITLWNDLGGIVTYWVTMIAIGWAIGLLAWGVVS